ncbi:aminotransferase class I/II-fold pyridoxal phosphate-dependent enzyme [Nitriliruptor alkaliphilus]|uniref:aminotransferase class I/II-fold pyridoxal phosphate-dependent enzyme n=1 Tax=Nitriliruptor alkaliphilus TaxID=427918 RepID=UPI0009F8D783|nr:aminotransferase class I/II-fold pyridoxal phosphate-dependent enzyme [Nitriliruptor alkaliphilus]
MQRERTAPIATRLRGLSTSVFSEISALAHQHGAANLGQGFPDDGPPEHVVAAAHAALDAGHHQYAPGPGIPALRRAIADHQQRFHGQHVDAETEVTVTFGATEAVTAAVLALCDPGDEVIVLDPVYDSYTAVIAMAAAAEVRVPIDPPTEERGWHLDLDRLAAAITPRTRLLLLNSPHNPTGLVLTADELDRIASLCVDRDLTVVTDEVYEHLVHDGSHVPLATRPGMAERTLTVSSLGKTFSCTGWKVGWAVAPPPLTEAVRAVKQFLSFAGGTPLQHAAVTALGSDDTTYAEVTAGNARRHALIVDRLRDADVRVVPSAGTYFVTVDLASLGHDDADAFARRAPEEHGVAVVPIAAFSGTPDALRSWARLAACKREDVLVLGIDRLIASRRR